LILNSDINSINYTLNLIKLKGNQTIITLCDTNFRPQRPPAGSYKFFVAENESANEYALSRHILKKIGKKSLNLSHSIIERLKKLFVNLIPLRIFLSTFDIWVLIKNNFKFCQKGNRFQLYQRICLLCETASIINHADSRNDRLPIPEARREKQYSSFGSDVAYRTAPIYRRATHTIPAIA